MARAHRHTRRKGGREAGWTEQERREAPVPELPTGASRVQKGRESLIACENDGCGRQGVSTLSAVRVSRGGAAYSAFCLRRYSASSSSSLNSISCAATSSSQMLLASLPFMARRSRVKTKEARFGA